MSVYQLSPFYTGAVYLGLAVGLVVLLWLARHYASSPAARGWPLLILRAAVVGSLVLLLLNPVLLTETRLPPETPETIFLTDSSLSMMLERPISRLEQMERTLQQVGRLTAHNPDPGISRYGFGDGLVFNSMSEPLRAGDDATRLFEALRSLPARFGRQRPSAVIVFSDGRATDTGDLDEIAGAYRRLDVPIHAFPVGDPDVVGDVAIRDLMIPREAPEGARIPIRFQLRGHGFSGRRAQVRVRSQADPFAKPLAALPITLSDGTQTHEMAIDSDGSGGELVLAVPVLPGEAISENNQVAFRIAARDEEIRVIYMEGSSRKESGYVRDALAEDPDIHCLVMSLHNQNVKPQRLYRHDDARRGYPTTRKELFEYDVVICSDIARSAFTEDQLQWTRELVAERGGGFAMVGGDTAFGSGGWDQTVWEKLIPCDMSGRYGRRTLYHDFRIVVPPEAERHPVWRIVEDPVENRRILDRIPAFHGTNYVDRVKPGATVLGHTDRILPGRMEKQSIFACQPYGKGRTFAMTTDTTYQWGTDFERRWGQADNRYFRKFWRNVVHWLAENSARGNRRLRVELDKVVYRPEESIHVTARAYDEELDETDRYRIVARIRPSRDTQESAGTSSPRVIQEATLIPKGDPPVYQGQLDAVPPRRGLLSAKDSLSAVRLLELAVDAYDGEQSAARIVVDVQILDDSVEFHNPRPDIELLEDLAVASGGEVLHTAGELAQSLDSRGQTPGEIVVHRTPVWDHPLPWLFLLGLLVTEWIMRRRRGLA